jgi:AcrR family transcriptional regulator
MQIIGGLCGAISEKGYAATTIADIVRHARVSKRTFYENFADKQACFLAAYRELSEQTIALMTSAVDAAATWEEQLTQAVATYFAVLGGEPALTRTFLLEIHAAGPRALELRREVMDRFAEVTRRLVDEARKRQPRLKRLSPAMATAIVGGVNELMLLKVEEARPTKELAQTATELVRALVAP